MEQLTWHDFGAFLRRARTRRGISQEKLAKQMPYDRTHIWRLEKGERHPNRQFLRPLTLSLAPLTPTEQEALAAFKQMAEYH
jgi:transcriptional regulator with XRE-family HTH domain